MTTNAIEDEAAFVLHSRDYKENSLLIDFYTLNHGLIRAVGRSVKKSSSKALVQPFIPLKLSLFKSKGELYSLKDCRQSGENIVISIPNYFCGTYANELISYLCPEEESCPKLFASYLCLLRSLSEGQDPVVPLRDFELNLIESLGYEISFSCEGKMFDPEERYFYSLASGFKPALSAENQDGGYFQGSDLIKIAQGNYRGAALKELTRVVLDFLLHGRVIRSRSLYADYRKLVQ